MMNMFEAPQILSAASKLNISEMDWKDQMIYIAAANEMAEKIKPLVVKYANKLPKNEAFLLKL